MNEWINLGAIWRTVVIGLAAGAGLPALFAVGLRALGPASEPDAEAVVRWGGRTAAGLCFAVVLAGIGWGVYFIVHSS